MRTRELKMALATADPVDLESMETEMLADLDGEQPAAPGSVAGPPHRRRPRRLALALGGATLAATATAIVVLAGRGAPAESQSQVAPRKPHHRDRQPAREPASTR